MSKRHQASRRRTYGRRQHEVHERVLRRVHERLDVRVDAFGSDADGDRLGFFDGDLGSPRFRFAVGD
jgi:hypothetical protein